MSMLVGLYGNINLLTFSFYCCTPGRLRLYSGLDPRVAPKVDDFQPCWLGRTLHYLKYTMIFSSS